MKYCVFLVIATLLTAEKSDKVTWTMYNVANENDFPSGSDIALNNCDRKTFAKVNEEFAKSIRLEGSGYLKKGIFLNLACGCEGCEGDNCGYDCFEQTTGPKGSNDNDLKPYISIAVKTGAKYKYGKKIMVKELNGKKLPSGEVHNGCVRVHDECGTCENSKWLDFYVYSKKNLDWMDSKYNLDKVNADYPSDCQLKSYKA